MRRPPPFVHDTRVTERLLRTLIRTILNFWQFSKVRYPEQFESNYKPKHSKALSRMEAPPKRQKNAANRTIRRADGINILTKRLLGVRTIQTADMIAGIRAEHTLTQ